MTVDCGFLTRFTAAIVLVHRPYGFFANWFGNQAGQEARISSPGHLHLRGIDRTGAGVWSGDRDRGNLEALNP
jgi:hypothetical protein